MKYEDYLNGAAGHNIKTTEMSEAEQLADVTWRMDCMNRAELRYEAAGNYDRMMLARSRYAALEEIVINISSNMADREQERESNRRWWNYTSTAA